MTAASISTDRIGRYVCRADTWTPVREAAGKRICYIDLSSVDNETKRIIGHQEILADEAPSRARQLVQAGDILLSTVRPNLNSVARVPKELDGATASTGFCILRPDRARLSSEYLFQWVKSPAFVHDMTRKATGANYPAVSDRIIFDSEIPLPPLDEQKRIAAILDQADHLRRLRERAINRLNELGQAIFYEMFGDPAKASKEYQLLGTYLSFITSGGRGWAEFYAPNGSRFVRSLDVQMNYIDNQDVTFVVPPDNAEARRTRVESGDVLLTITGSRIGRVAPVPNDFGPAYISQHVAILRLKSNVILPIFMSYFLSLDFGGQRQIRKAQYGQTKPGLNFDQIRMFKVPVPPINEQHDFCRRILEITHMQHLLNDSYTRIDTLFASLQQRAFSGEL